MPGHCWERNQSEPEDLGAKVKCERTFASLKEAVGMSSEGGSGMETHLPQGPRGREKGTN